MVVELRHVERWRGHAQAARRWRYGRARCGRHARSLGRRRRYRVEQAFEPTGSEELFAQGDFLAVLFVHFVDIDIAQGAVDRLGELRQ